MPAFLGVMFLLVGCGQYKFRYAPTDQPDNFNPIFADYRVKGNTLEILIDTHGIKLITARITLADGSIVTPQGIDYPAFAPVMIGVGNSVDNTRGVDRAQGPTIVRFDKSAVGSAPWKVMVQVAGTKQTYVNVGSTNSSGYDKPLVYPLPEKEETGSPTTQPTTAPATRFAG